tara:strand:+ start:160 stop:384 length:225 start_codon:yes stop_codon:yes gene_type:complete
MDFDEYFKKMCGNPEDTPSSSFKAGGTATPFNKKELRWLKDQLETCIEWCDKKDESDYMYKNMLKKVKERLEML